MRLISFLLMLALMACSDGYTATQNTSYTPPATPGGRMCTHQCLEAQDFCAQDCGQKNRECVMAVQKQAIEDYEKYTHEQYASHQPIEFNTSDFEHNQSCAEHHKSCLGTCDNHYQKCYGDCGGKVNATSSCQFLCF